MFVLLCCVYTVFPCGESAKEKKIMIDNCFSIMFLRLGVLSLFVMTKKLIL